MKTLTEIGTLTDTGALDLNTAEAATMLRVVFEIVYVMGYREGKKDANHPCPKNPRD